MDWSVLFSLINGLALFGWLVLLLAPRRWVWLGQVPRLLVPGCIALIYTALMAAFVFEAGGGFSSIAEVRTLFMSDPVLVAGWGHYPAFDLLIGGLIAERLDRAGVSRWLQTPVLALTFMFGPAGWLLGLATEAAARWRSRPAAQAQA